MECTTPTLNAIRTPPRPTMERMRAPTRLLLCDCRGNIISQLAAILSHTAPVLPVPPYQVNHLLHPRGVAPRFLLLDLRPLLHATAFGARTDCAYSTVSPSAHRRAPGRHNPATSPCIASTG